MENRLREIIISITGRCNLRCAMCQIPQAEDQEEMTTQELRVLIKDAVFLCPTSIVFSGGEPLLRKDIFELIVLVNQHKINTCLTSNGILVTEEVAKKLAASGIGVVNISIEGTEDIHDSLRGRGNYRKALEALGNLSKHKIETTIATVVCRQNYKFLPQVMDLAHRLGVTTVKFQPFSDIFLFDKEKRDDFRISQDMKSDLTNSIEKVIEMSGEYKISINPADYMRSIPEYFCGTQVKRAQSNCPALWSTCPISSQGDVYPCWVLSDRVLGNVNKNRLSGIWNSAKHDIMRRSILEEGCTGCMMSCYDYNMGKYAGSPMSSKVRKLKHIEFYKKFYFRIYQNTKYIIGKIFNRLVDMSKSHLKDDLNKNDVLDEIKQAKSALKKMAREV